MAVDAGSIRSEVKLALGDLKNDVLKVQKTLTGITTATEKTSKKGSASIGLLKKAFIGFAGVAGVGLAVRGLKKLASLSIFQQKQEQQLAARIKSTGQAAGLTAKELTTMASGFQKVTTFGDEVIIGAQSLLLTFTKIGKDVFPRATETILDMSVAFGQDLKSSSIQLGKALNDPIQGVTALRRVGVQLTKQQEDQIKTFQNSGDIMSAQNIILNELETQVGGAARAARQGVGVFEALGNVVGDIGEKLGSKVVKALGPLAESLVGIGEDVANFLETEESLTTVTDELTEASRSYNAIVKELAENSGTLNESEENSLKTRKQIAELAIIKNVIALNKTYIASTKNVSELNKKQLEQAKALAEVDKTLNDDSKIKKANEILTRQQILSMGLFAKIALGSKKNIVELTGAQSALLGVGTALKDSNTGAITIIAKQSEVLGAYLEAVEKAKTSNVDFGTALGEQEKAIDNAAQAIVDGALSFGLLKGASDAVKEAIQQQVDVINALAKAKRNQGEEEEVLTQKQIDLMADLAEKQEEVDATDEELALIKIEREREKALAIADNNDIAIAKVNEYYDTLRDKTAYEEQLANEEELAVNKIRIADSVRNSLNDIAGNIFDVAINTATKGGKKEKELKEKQFKVQQAFDIVEIVISGIKNANIAFATSVAQLGPIAGPIAGGILASIIGVGATASAIAVGTKKPNFNSGGIVPGSSSGNADNIDIRAKSGESIMTMEQQKRLFDIANGNGNGNGNGNTGGGTNIFQVVAQTGEVLEEFIFQATKNGTMKVHSNSLVAI